MLPRNDEILVYLSYEKNAAGYHPGPGMPFSTDFVQVLQIFLNS